MALSSRTGVESLLISIRSSAENYTQPLSFCSSKAIVKYFTMVWRTTPLEIACKMEAYLLSGVGGKIYLRYRVYLLDVSRCRILTC